MRGEDRLFGVEHLGKQTAGGVRGEMAGVKYAEVLGDRFVWSVVHKVAPPFVALNGGACVQDLHHARRLTRRFPE